MDKKEHGTCTKPVQENLLYGVDREVKGRKHFHFGLCDATLVAFLGSISRPALMAGTHPDRLASHVLTLLSVALAGGRQNLLLQQVLPRCCFHSIDCRLECRPA